MSTPQGTVRQRGQKKSKSATTSPNVEKTSDSEGETIINSLRDQVSPKAQSDWDFKIALVVITVLAFITRFYGIRHPNQVVFDEVHFGKVKDNPAVYDV